MKKQILISLIILSSILSMNAQTRVPNDGVSPIWYNNDKVGIGTTELHQQFSVTGGIGFANQNSIDKKLFSPIDGTLEWFTHDWATEHAFAVSHQGQRRVYLNTNGHSYFIGGNVGIGTATPSEILEIYNSDTTPGTISLKSSRNDFGYVDVGRISAKQASIEISRIGMPRAGGTNTGYLTFWTKSDNATDLTEKVRISEIGNVGIGTTTPDSKLTVNGNIHAKEVRIDLSIPAPDYVFANGYKLKTLQEVEEYIKQNSHLPEIPSAKEFKKNGLMLAEMNMSLLKKIEEMTLYMIEQSKQMQILKKDNEAFRSLSERLSKIENKVNN